MGQKQRIIQVKLQLRTSSDTLKMTTRHLLTMAALLGGLGTVCCVPPQQLSPLSQKLRLEEGSLVPANSSSQDLDNRIDDILEEIARLKEDNKWLSDEIRNNMAQLTEMIQNFAVAPIGTISAWVTKPTKDGDETVNLPEGWVRCSGETIPEPSVWAGQLTPNLNGEKRFLRGSPDSEMLKMEEDQMQDHKHTVSDPGHSHSYDDKYTNHAGHDEGHWGPRESDKTHDRYDKSHASTSAKSPTGITVQGVASKFREIDVGVGDETRPKNMNVIYIMRVW